MVKKNFRIGLLVILVLCSFFIFSCTEILNFENNYESNEQNPKTSGINKWTSTAFINNWRGIDMSESGQYIIATAQNGSWLSNDYGRTWSQKRTGNFADASISNDGSTILCVESFGNIHVSYDFGGTWYQRTPLGFHYGCTMSSTGQYMFIAPVIVTGIRRSIDYGVSWSYSDAPALLINVACSSTGQYVSFVRTGVGEIKTSSNYGVSFITRFAGNNLKAVDIDDSGQYQYFAQFNGNLYGSNDYGVNWNPILSLNTAFWQDIVCSGNGSYVLACLGNGYMYESYDYGNNWNIETTLSENWYSISMNHNGTFKVATTNGGYIWIKEVIPKLNIGFPIFLRNTYSLSSYIIMFLLVGLILLSFSKFKSYILTLIVFLFSIIIGFVSMSESYIPFTPFIQIFFLLFQFSIFMVITLQKYNKRERY